MQDLNSTQKTFFVLVLTLAFIIRIVNIDRHSIWTDEKTSVLIANGIKYGDAKETRKTIFLSEFKVQNTPENVLAASINDNGNSIVYNFMLHYWTGLFGNSDFAIRFLSLLFSMAGLIVAFFFCLRNINYRTALLVLILLTIQSLSVTYAHEARNYALTVFFTLCATWIFWEFFIQKSTQLTWTKVILYAFFCTLSILSHYLSAYIFIAHSLIALFYLRGKKSWLHFIFAGILAVIVFGAWMLSGGLKGLEIMGYQNAVYIEIVKNYKPGDSTFVMPSTMFNIIIGIVQVWLQEFGNGLQAFFRVREIAIFILLPIVVIAYTFKFQHEKRKLLITLIAIVLTQTLFATYLALNSGHTISFQPLYSIFASPYAIIALAIGFIFLIEKHKKTTFVLIGAQVIISCFSVYAALCDLPKSREKNPYSTFVKKLEEHNIDNDTIIAPSLKDAQLLSLYLSPEKNYTFEIDSSFVDAVRLKKNDALVLELKNLRY